MTQTEPNAADAIDLWFFRELADEQRATLIYLVLGDKIAAEAKNHGLQRLCLKRIIEKIRDASPVSETAKLVKNLKWALQDAVSTNAENCRQRDWWKHAHAQVEAELTANEKAVTDMIEALKDVAWGLETAQNALAWAARRASCPDYANVISNDARNAGRVLGRAKETISRLKQA